ncbi:SPOR domain-containing protein [Streptomyces montanisoli]|uniref:SPOR domain-containing protein n=1 Tax=Streptomyces montanisoli TaxID=2798581 RepID=A0A940MCK0_9ACTN|nr:SPOR domain-containing protein [Streptomyces montanisoli]MBP0458413.1 SPOR domain-containing protein [Streptomyces montanisoli]
MTEGGTALPWQVVREDGNGNRYRVAWYATRDEAQRLAESLDGRREEGTLYCVEHAERAADVQLPERVEQSAP